MSLECRQSSLIFALWTGAPSLIKKKKLDRSKLWIHGPSALIHNFNKIFGGASLWRHDNKRGGSLANECTPHHDRGPPTLECGDQAAGFDFLSSRSPDHHLLVLFTNFKAGLIGPDNLLPIVDCPMLMITGKGKPSFSLIFINKWLLGSHP